VEGSIWGGTGRDGGSTELRRRPAMVAANVASLMVLGNGGLVVEGQREVENVVGCLDWRMGRRREELGVQGRRRLQWRAADGEMRVWAREGARGSFHRRQGEGGRTGEGELGAAAWGRPGQGRRWPSTSWRAGARAGGGGCVAAQRGAREKRAGGARAGGGGKLAGRGAWPARWRLRRRTAPSLRREGERTEEEEAVSGSFVIRPKFQNPVL
jgi:hypothetical protein